MKGSASVKVESGKLVKVEVDYTDAVKDVSITGDFFLQPPEALEELEKALEGVDVNASESDIVAVLKQVDAEPIGFDWEDVATAVSEATASKNWRIINEGEYSEAMHHAIDEVLTERMEEGNMRPTLRFWYRKNVAVPMGRFQSYSDEVQGGYVEENGIEVVRRITGGGAMYAEPGNVITYSLYLPKEMVPEDVEESYRELDRFAVEALNSLGLEVEWKPLNDIEHADGKVGGAAQLRKQNAVLHHTMLSYDLDTRKMLKALRIGKEKVSDKAIESAEKRVAVMKDYIDHSREEVIAALIEHFTQQYGGEEGELTDEELTEAEKLAEEKFSGKKWTQKL